MCGLIYFSLLNRENALVFPVFECAVSCGSLPAELCSELSIFTWEGLLRVQLEPEKQRPPKTWQKLLLNSALFSTAPMA